MLFAPHSQRYMEKFLSWWGELRRLKIVDNFFTPFSCLFRSIAFPMAEVISTYIPPSFYEVSMQVMNEFMYALCIDVESREGNSQEIASYINKRDVCSEKSYSILIWLLLGIQ